MSGGLEDATDWLVTLSPVQLKKLYEVSQLQKGQIDTDWIAGYWAMYAGWPRPDPYSEAADGWNEAVKEYEGD